MSSVPAMNSEKRLTPGLFVRGRAVVLPEGVQPACLDIVDGVIQRVLPYDTPVQRSRLIDAQDAVVMPGLVDTHVHCNEPGRSEWEGFAFATCAAAAGGVTTVIDMPLNSIPATTTTTALRSKLESADKQSWVDVGFWGGVVPGNVGELRPLLDAGIVGFKCFLCESGVPEFPAISVEELRLALGVLQGLPTVLSVHAEMKDVLVSSTQDFAALPTHRRRHYLNYLVSRPEAAETEAISLLIELCRRFAVPVHIVHLSSARSLPALAQAQREGVPISVETCPHYLFFAAEDIRDGATEFKCAPPIREASNRELLWEGLRAGIIGSVASDHSPCPPTLKQTATGDFASSWGGIASLQISLPALWTAARQRGFGVSDVARWMCQAPAARVGLDDRKGVLAPGKDADLVCWQPDAAFGVEESSLLHRHKLTPYAGKELYGIVEWTMVRGRTVFAEGRVHPIPQGKILRRGTR